MGVADRGAREAERVREPVARAAQQFERTAFGRTLAHEVCAERTAEPNGGGERGDAQPAEQVGPVAVEGFENAEREVEGERDRADMGHDRLDCVGPRGDLFGEVMVEVVHRWSPMSC